MANLAVNGGKALYEEKDAMMPLAWPPVSEETAERIKELYLSRAWSFNSETEQAFEKAYAAYHDAKFGVFMVNGTVTLESALLALGIGPGDEVIVPALTWIATAMCVKYVGAKVVFADIDPNTFCLDPDSFEQRITPKTKAVIPVHLYAGIADLGRILEIADKHGVKVIEDCAHMQGGKWNGRGVGSWGAVGSFSFQQSKTLAAGESGICITSDDDLALRMYRVKHIGYPPDSRQGHASGGPEAGLICHNYRGLAIPARILLDQLPGMEDILCHYDACTGELARLTADLPNFRLQGTDSKTTRRGYYALGMVFEAPFWGKVTLDRLGAALHAEGVRCLEYTYGPVYKHILFNMDAKDYRQDACPVTEHICDRTICIAHFGLYYKENAVKLSEALHKIAANIGELEE